MAKDLIKIRKISVKKLFGMFDHDIPINKDVGITIVIGENGLGKTILLEMIESFFQGKYVYFNSVLFKEFIVEFEDRIKWVIEKKKNTKDGTTSLEVSQVSKNKRKTKPLKLINLDDDNNKTSLSDIVRNNPYLQRINSQIWEDRRTGEILHTDELIHRYRHSYRRRSRHIQSNLLDGAKIPAWFNERHSNIKVKLIETQRLINLKNNKEKTHYKTVEKYSEEITINIKKYLTESTELSSKLDRTYPNRLVERLSHSTTHVTDEYLNTNLKKLEEKRALLDAVGLIEIEKDSNILEIDKPAEDLKDVLMLYLEDSFQKIEIFDEITRKIELLLKVINKRFKHKTFNVDKEHGFVFNSTILKDKEGNYISIPVSKLSSGEQNELVLFYELLFNTTSNSLILIDEPEVSLHISWQNSFIEDLKEIATLNKFEVVIATHSPDIISNNWDLKIELKGLE